MKTMKNKKWLCITLSVLLLILTLVGCGSSDVPQESDINQEAIPTLPKDVFPTMETNRVGAPPEGVRLVYVSTTGDDTTGDGSVDNTYKTIKKAAEVAQAGDIVLVRAGTYYEHSIKPNSGTADAMIVFRPENPGDKVIIKHPETFPDAKTPEEKREAYLDAGAAGKLTDVFDLLGCDYVQIEGFIFRDYEFARNTIDINGTGNVVINCQFINIGCEYQAPSVWISTGPKFGDITIHIRGSHNVIRNNYFQSIYGECLSMNQHTNNNIIAWNTLIDIKAKDGSTASTLGGRFVGNIDNVFAFNYNGGTESGYSIWLDVEVIDFITLRNVAHNTGGLIFNESGCERNWVYENIAYNLPLGSDGRMIGATHFSDFSAQRMKGGFFPAFWDTGSTWDARWINNVTYNVESGFTLERSWRDEVRNNIAYEDMFGPISGTSLGIRIKEPSIIGYLIWDDDKHGYDLKGGGPQIIRNNLWYSTKRENFVRYMEPSQGPITVDALNAQTRVGDLGAYDLSVDPMFVDAPAGDFRLMPGSPAIGAGDNGVDIGAYAIYPAIEVGYNENLSLLAYTHADFKQTMTYAKPGDTIEIELGLNRIATIPMSFKITPVAGDARVDVDFSFAGDTIVTFNPGEKTKTISIEILEGNPTHKFDQLLALRIEPADTFFLNDVGPRNLHLIKIIRATEYSLTVNNAGDSMGVSKVEFIKPGTVVTVDAGTYPGLIFAYWETSYHGNGFDAPLEAIHSAQTTFVMPDFHVSIQARWRNPDVETPPDGWTIRTDGMWNPNTGGFGRMNNDFSWTYSVPPVRVTAISLDYDELALTPQTPTHPLSATIEPDNASLKGVIWTSSNPLVATVSDDGLITAHSDGTATIIARSLSGRRTARCTVTVTGYTTP